MSLSELKSKNLPSSLDALQKSHGLPINLVRKAEEVRIEGGAERIQRLIADGERLASICRGMCEEVC